MESLIKIREFFRDNNKYSNEPGVEFIDLGNMVIEHKLYHDDIKFGRILVIIDDFAAVTSHLRFTLNNKTIDVVKQVITSAKLDPYTYGIKNKLERIPSFIKPIFTVGPIYDSSLISIFAKGSENKSIIKNIQGNYGHKYILESDTIDEDIQNDDLIAIINDDDDILNNKEYIFSNNEKLECLISNGTMYCRDGSKKSCNTDEYGISKIHLI